MSDLTDLNAFLLVARSKGFRQAARESGVSSSALSDAVKRLEEDLGVRPVSYTHLDVYKRQAFAIVFVARLHSDSKAVVEVSPGLEETLRMACTDTIVGKCLCVQVAHATLKNAYRLALNLKS